MPTTLSGWGHFGPQPCYVARPESADEVRRLLAQPADTTWIARGLGRSYGDSAVNAHGGVMLSERLVGPFALDEQAGVLTCSASASLGEIVESVLPRGFFLEVTPGTRFVTVGGAIAADVHGKNHHRDGGFAGCLVDFDLLTPAGETLRCSRDENTDIFWATIGGMGLTGVILEARLRLRRVETAYIEVEYAKAADLDGTLELLFDTADCYTYSIAWIDCLAPRRRLGRSVLMQGDHAGVEDLAAAQRGRPLDVPPKRRWSLPCGVPGVVLNRATIRVFNAMIYRRHKAGRRIVDYDTFFYPLDHVLHWNRLYGRRGFVQYQVLLPYEMARTGLIRLLEGLSREGLVSFLAGIKTAGAASGGWLSFMSPGITIALDIPWHRDLTARLQRLDELVLSLGGRLYLAKDATMQPETFAAMYPRLEAFRELKARLDPAGILSSSQSRRLGIT